MEKIQNLDAAFAQALRKFREQANFTQQELAEKAGCSKAYIQNLEYAQRSPTVNAFLLVASALEINPHELLDEILATIVQLGSLKNSES